VGAASLAPVPLLYHKELFAHATFPGIVTEQGINVQLHKAFSFQPVHAITAARRTPDASSFFNSLR
jgi:hypothetical protein